MFDCENTVDENVLTSEYANYCNVGLITVLLAW